MTSLGRRFGLALACAAITQVAASAAVQPKAPPAPAKPKPPSQPPVVAAPADLRQQLTGLGRNFDGKVGMAVVSLNDGWEIDWNANTLFPQQSCSKLWVAITAMDAVDRGKVSLDQPVTLTPADLTLFHQPIREKVLATGSYTTTLGSLLFQAITESDNTANDKLMRSVGGPQAVRDTIARKGLGAIRFYDGERALQSKIAGLLWSQSY